MTQAQQLDEIQRDTHKILNILSDVISEQKLLRDDFGQLQTNMNELQTNMDVLQNDMTEVKKDLKEVKNHTMGNAGLSSFSGF